MKEFAQDVVKATAIGFDRDVKYDIYYEVSTFEVDVVKNVQVSRLITILDQSYLEISGSDFGTKEKKGYILLESVRALLPSGYIEPKRVFADGNNVGSGGK